MLVLRDFQAKGVRKFEISTLEEIAHQESIWFLMQGGRWGETLQHQASPNLLSIRQKNHRLHPTIQRFAVGKYMIKSVDDHYIYHSQWKPSSAVNISTNNGENSDLPNPSQEELEALQSSFDVNYPEHKISMSNDDLKFTWVRGFDRLQSYRTSKIRVGDDVSIIFNGLKEAIFVQKCLLITKDVHRYCFIFPLWYDYINRNAVPSLVSKWSGNSDTLIPVPADSVQEQIFVLHNCHRKCDCGDNLCQCVLCEIQHVCVKHDDSNCNFCADFVQQDVHNLTHNEYYIFDRSLGFEPDY